MMSETFEPARKERKATSAAELQNIYMADSM